MVYLQDIPVMFCKHYGIRNRQFCLQLQVLFLECTRKRQAISQFQVFRRSTSNGYFTAELFAIFRFHDCVLITKLLKLCRDCQLFIYKGPFYVKVM